MPTPTNLIDSVQQLYAGLASFTGKPGELWFGTSWPRNSAGTLTALPLVRFRHTGTPADATLEYTASEFWGFRFEVFAATGQQALTIFDRIRFNGQPPESAAGFWYASTVEMPTGYAYKSFEPRGEFLLQELDGQFSPTGGLLFALTWDMVLHVLRNG